MASRIYSNLAAAQAVMRADLLKQLQASGDWPFGSAEYTVLRTVASASGGTAIFGLADFLAIPRTSARRIIDNLAHAGLLTNRQDQHDRRVRHWLITERGLQAVRQVPGPESEGQFTRSLQALSRSEREVLARQLPVLLQAVKEPIAQGASLHAIEHDLDNAAKEVDTLPAVFALW
ncbi:MAG: hypothetical protein GEV04_24560, partial [Actinophytocola sp.]|nr:hypothetical protein [Actinophytocola sp.]